MAHQKLWCWNLRPRSIGRQNIGPGAHFDRRVPALAVIVIAVDLLDVPTAVVRRVIAAVEPEVHELAPVGAEQRASEKGPELLPAGQ